jgi:septal ring factor EnvC (AmiA/AmiB activator)
VLLFPIELLCREGERHAATAEEEEEEEKKKKEKKKKKKEKKKKKKKITSRKPVGSHCGSWRGTKEVSFRSKVEL